MRVNCKKQKEWKIELTQSFGLKKGNEDFQFSKSVFVNVGLIQRKGMR